MDAIDLATALSWEDERILRITGVLLAVFGAILVSPHGFKRLLYVIKEWMIRVWRAIRGGSVNIAPTAGTASVGAHNPRVQTGTNIPPDAPVEEQVRLLRTALGNLQVLVDDDYKELSGKIDKLTNLVRSVDTRTETLHKRMQQAQEEATSIDAAGLPVIAWGIILSGVPQELAGEPQVGWFFIVVGLILAVAMFRKTIRDGAWRKKSSEA